MATVEQSREGPPAESGRDAGGGANVRFTEEMKGYVTFAEEDFQRGYERGRESDNYLMFHLTIEVEGIDDFIANPRHEAAAHGWIRCEELGGELPVERGIFNLFVDTDREEEKRMLYRLHFADGVGHPLTLTGYKVIANDPGLDLWPDTSTLYTRVLSGHVDEGTDEGAEVVASGILRIRKLDFLRQLTTFRASGESAGQSLRALVLFNRLFMDQLRRIYARDIPAAVGAGAGLAALGEAGRRQVAKRRRPTGVRGLRDRLRPSAIRDRLRPSRGWRWWRR
jgi:cholesterol oxidase